MATYDPPTLAVTTNTADASYDSVVVVTDSTDKLTGTLSNLKTIVDNYISVDPSGSSSVVLIVSDAVSGSKLIYSPTGPLNRDQDDVRRIYDAADTGIKRALAAGSTKPLLVRPPDAVFVDADRCALLGALHALYTPLEIREARPSDSKKATDLGWWYATDSVAANNLITLVEGLEAGRYASRDIGGSDPERMAPPRVAEYVESLFSDADSAVTVTITQGHSTFEADYPLLAAVNRACKDIPRHQGRIIWLTYQGEGTIDKTLLLVGKGICYDTGGADIKAGGVMAGMHRDKCGAASVAGFFRILDKLRPKGIRVQGAMAMVRNSVGSQCYVADEIITSRAGCRVRVGNTDAEGRMAMTDVLCAMKERALDTETNPDATISTWATLTGHVIIAHGDQYSAVLGNGPACDANIPQDLITNGIDMADPCQLSTIMREDYDFAKGKSEYEDVLQCNNEPSSKTPRGHQFPAAFMILASGLDQYGKQSATPLKYVHVDVAGSAGPFPGIPTGAPLLAFAKTYIIDRL